MADRGCRRRPPTPTVICTNPHATHPTVKRQTDIIIEWQPFWLINTTLSDWLPRRLAVRPALKPDPILLLSKHWFQRHLTFNNVAGATAGAVKAAQSDPNYMYVSRLLLDRVPVFHKIITPAYLQYFTVPDRSLFIIPKFIPHFTRYTDTFCNAVDCRLELALEVQR